MSLQPAERRLLTEATLNSRWAVEARPQVSAVPNAAGIRLQPYSIEDEEYRPLGFIDGTHYARPRANSAAIEASTDGGRTWERVQSTGITNLGGIFPLAAGEVLLLTGSALYRSNGWGTDPATATWEEIITSPGVSIFQTWGVATNPATGRIFCTSYVNFMHAPDFTDSRYAWLSTDNGDTFSVVFDHADRLSDPSWLNVAHNHVAAIDPYANDRLWVSWHTDTHPDRELLWSDDLGQTWNLMANAQPTSATPAKHGMVFGSDNSENGIHVVERTPDPADMRYVWAWEWEHYSPTFRLIGHANRGVLDESTGLAYVGFMVVTDTATSCVAVSDGRYAAPVWEHRDATHTSGSGTGIRGQMAVGDGVLRARLHDGEAKTLTVATLGHPLLEAAPDEPTVVSQPLTIYPQEFIRTLGDSEVIPLDVSATERRLPVRTVATGARIVAHTAVPDGWTSFHVDLWWTNLTSNTGTVRWGAIVRSLTDGLTLDGSAPLNYVVEDAPAQHILKRTRIMDSYETQSGGALAMVSLRRNDNQEGALAGDAAILMVTLTRAD